MSTLPDDDLSPSWSASAEQVFARYQMLQTYVDWSDEDVRRIRSLKGVAERLLPSLVDDFHDTIQANPEVLAFLTGGVEQVARLKRALKQWLRELFCGTYDADYVTRRWRVGRRHAQIGLPSVFIHAAMSRLRQGLIIGLQEIWPGEPNDLMDSLPSLNRLLDLDLMILVLACQTGPVERAE